MSDLISRQAAIDAICEHGTDLERRGITVLSVSNHKQATVDLLESLPSAQPERKKGRWTVTKPFITCSECGETFILRPQNYCPNCGAKMGGEEGE